MLSAKMNNGSEQMCLITTLAIWTFVGSEGSSVGRSSRMRKACQCRKFKLQAQVGRARFGLDKDTCCFVFCSVIYQ